MPSGCKHLVIAIFEVSLQVTSVQFTQHIIVIFKLEAIVIFNRHHQREKHYRDRIKVMLTHHYHCKYQSVMEQSLVY